jgi:hypothetical protein
VRKLEAMPSYERDRRLAVLALLVLVALMGLGAFALVVSGYTLV